MRSVDTTASSTVASAAPGAPDADARLTRLVELVAEGRARTETLRETLREIRGLDRNRGARRAPRDRTVLQNGARVAELLDGAILQLDEATSRRSPRFTAANGVSPSWPHRSVRSRRWPFGSSPRVSSSRTCADTLCRYRDRADFDPARLESIESRRAPSSGSSSSGAHEDDARQRGHLAGASSPRSTTSRRARRANGVAEAQPPMNTPPGFCPSGGRTRARLGRRSKRVEASGPSRRRVRDALARRAGPRESTAKAAFRSIRRGRARGVPPRRESR